MPSFPKTKDTAIVKRMDPSKVGSHGRRASSGSQKLLQSECDLGGTNSLHNCLVEVDPKNTHARNTPSRHVIGAKNRLKDVHNGLTTSKELLKVLTRIWRLEHENSTVSSLVSALQFELDRACIHVNKLIKEHRGIDVLINHFEEERAILKIKEQERVHNAITSIAGELEIEKKLKRQTERLNKKLGKELAETRANLSIASKELESEKRAREILEQVCEELAQGIGEDKRESEKIRQEVEKEREMLQLADLLREERVQMKLSEAKYQFEEKNAILDELRGEFEIYLKSKTVDQKREEGSPSYDKIKELENYLRETLPGSNEFQETNQENIEQEEEGDESDDSDLHSIELNVDDIRKNFQWSDSVKNNAKKNLIDKNKGRKPVSCKIKKPIVFPKPKFEDGIKLEITSNKQENLELFDERGLFGFASKSCKKGVEDELERYKMIKDLRDQIFSGTRIVPSQEFDSPSEKIWPEEHFFKN